MLCWRFQITHRYGSILHRLRFSVMSRGYSDMGANGQAGVGGKRKNGHWGWQYDHPVQTDCRWEYNTRLRMGSFHFLYVPSNAVTSQSLQSNGTASTLHSRCVAVFHSRRDDPRSTGDAGGDLELSRGPRRYRGVRSLSVLVVAQGEVPKPKGFMIPGVAETKRARRECTGIFAFVLVKKLSTPSFKTV